MTLAAASHRAVAPHPVLQGTYAVVLAGGRGSRLRQLTDWRAKPAMPFGGQLKIIDFALSNCVNSGIRRIGVLTQYKAQSLIRHVTRGWAFLDESLGEFVDVMPAQQRIDEAWYSGTANAVWQNVDMLREAKARHVLVLAGDHVYKMDYACLVREHERRGADVTVASIEVPLETASAFGVMQLDDDGRVRAFQEKPARPAPVPGRPDRALASMGIYVFDAAFLFRELRRDAADAASGHDFGSDLLPALVARARVFAHDFAASCVGSPEGRPYWRDVGTVDAYWEANMDLTRPDPELDLYDASWPIHTLAHQLPPARLVLDASGRHGTAVDSLLAGGSVVTGAAVHRSVLFSKVQVGEGSEIEDSLVLPDARVGRNVRLRRAIIDKHCVLPDGLRVGVNPAEDRARFAVSERGVTLVVPEMLGQRVHEAG